jgi:hypothetical protein
MADPFSPVPEIRKHNVQDQMFTDAYGDTWQVIDGIETKVRYADPVGLLKRTDAARKQCRADLDALGLRETVPTELSDGTVVEMLPPSLAAQAFSFGEAASPENLLAIEVAAAWDEAITINDAMPKPNLWQRIARKVRSWTR